MTRWTALDWAFTVGPFVVLAGLAVWAVRAQRWNGHRTTDAHT